MCGGGPGFFVEEAEVNLPRVGGRREWSMTQSSFKPAESLIEGQILPPLSSHCSVSRVTEFMNCR